MRKIHKIQKNFKNFHKNQKNEIFVAVIYQLGEVSKIGSYLSVWPSFLNYKIDKVSIRAKLKK